MLRKIVIFFAVFMVGMIASEEFSLLDFETIESSHQEINGDLSIISTDNTNDVIPHPPVHYEMVQPLRSVNGILHYAIGARRSSDRLVASGGQNQSWPQPHNVQIQLTYPSQGYGALVTYVAIVVNQTSSLGQAYVVKGGINQHQITIVVEAYNTNVFNVFAYVYGI
ncbi:uncharacterized protein LOC129566533 [Sitodiplosis mosellana]|uniref:uncharacterized protein LOC129566533 n=1 Tax=Sitodiplosis mosellana TaxID=263140 RepID=UPI00244410F4|nr:uncharacterized protein LOC129566533 [Sitodiplosis mosellana]